MRGSTSRFSVTISLAFLPGRPRTEDHSSSYARVVDLYFAQPQRPRMTPFSRFVDPEYHLLVQNFV